MIGGGRFIDANVVTGVDPRNGCAEKFHPPPIPRVSDVVVRENMDVILDCTGFEVEWNVPSHPSAEKVPVFLGSNAVCYVKQSLSERRQPRSRLPRTCVSSTAALIQLHALNPSAVCPAESGLELHMGAALTGGKCIASPIRMMHRPPNKACW